MKSLDNQKFNLSRILGRFIASSSLESFKLYSEYLEVTSQSVIDFSKGLGKNVTLKNFQLGGDFLTAFHESMNIILSSFESKSNFEKFSIKDFCKIKHNRVVFGDDKILDKIDSFLANNQSLRVFS